MAASLKHHDLSLCRQAINGFENVSNFCLALARCQPYMIWAAFYDTDSKQSQWKSHWISQHRENKRIRKKLMKTLNLIDIQNELIKLSTNVFLCMSETRKWWRFLRWCSFLLALIFITRLKWLFQLYLNWYNFVVVMLTLCYCCHFIILCFCLWNTFALIQSHINSIFKSLLD